MPEAASATRASVGAAAGLEAVKSAKAPAPFKLAYRRACYNLVGARIDRRRVHGALEDRLRQAGFGTTGGEHLAVLTVSTLIATGAALAAGFLLFGLLLHAEPLPLYVLAFAGIAAASVAGFFPLVISSRITNRRQQLEKELPYTLSELSVLASTGTSPIDLVRRVARREHDPAMTEEFRKVVYRVDVQGKDLITALGEVAKQAPSPIIRETFWDLGSMIHQGGSVDEYLRQKSQDALDLRRLNQKIFTDRLTTYAEMYISIVLIGVLFLSIGAFLIDVFGSTIGPLDASSLLLFLAYGLLPLIVVVMGLLLSMAYARAE